MKLDTWRALIDLLHTGTDDDWHAVRDAVSEARGTVYLADALQPPILRYLERRGHTIVIHTIFLDRIFYTGRPTASYSHNNRVWLEETDDGALIPLGSRDLYDATRHIPAPELSPERTGGPAR